MRRTGPTPGRSAATTFTRREIEAAHALFTLLARGGDARVMARADAIRAVAVKFARMRARIDTPGATADEVVLRAVEE